jgi:hypothetical protein
MEGAPGRERPEEGPSLAVASAVDVDGYAVVVAVASRVEAGLAVREASREPDARRHRDDAHEQYRESDYVHASLVHCQFHLQASDKENGERFSLPLVLHHALLYARLGSAAAFWPAMRPKML